MLTIINNNIINCTKCDLHSYEKNNNNKSDIGFGKLLPKYNDSSEIMIIGLNPSRNRFPNLKYAFGGGEYFKKDKCGYKFLQIFKKYGILNKCFITNSVKCSSPINKINKKYFQYCFIHLLQEIVFCKPKLIIATGNQVYNFLKEKGIKCVKVNHPSYCFSYHFISEKEYEKQIINLLKKSLSS